MSTPISALRAGLADEHAALYLLGVLASRTSSGALADALAHALADALAEAYVAHRTVRDALLERLAALGDTEPPGAAPAYDLPDGLETETGVRAAALQVEQRASAGYGDQVAATSGEDRRRAIAWLSASAVRQLSFGGSPTELPGL